MGRSDMLGGPGRQGPDAGLPGAAPGPAGLKRRELTPCGWSSGSSTGAVLGIRQSCVRPAFSIGVTPFKGPLTSSCDCDAGV